MKLNERRNQQCECDKETKPDRKVPRKEKAAKAKHPRHHDNHLKLTRRVGFENFQRYQNGQKRYAGLNAFESTVAEKDCTEHHGCEDEFQNSRTKPVTFRLHPEFQRQREKKEPCDPAREIAKHRGECEQQRGDEPKQRSPWDSGIFPLLCAPATLTHAHAHAHARGPSSPWKRLNARMHR